MKACLTKWIPPRADFVNTTTDTERDLLQQHSDWLNAMMADGLIVAHGRSWTRRGAMAWRFGGLVTTRSSQLCLHRIRSSGPVSAITSNFP
jgi:hypothetical protein